MILRFGIRIVTRGGKETLSRLIAIGSGVGIGIALFLAALSWLHALQTIQQRPCIFECASYSQSQTNNNNHPLLWRYMRDQYLGNQIQRLDIAKTGPTNFKLPGVSDIPGAGEYVASPALQKLLANKANTALRQRYPGKDVGTIASPALQKPNDLTIIVARPASVMQSLPYTTLVYGIDSSSGNSFSSPWLKFGILAAICILLFPIATLITAVTRIAAARREERFAALRLIGATMKQIAAIASIEAGIGALGGVVLGSALFWIVRPILAAQYILTGPFFLQDFRPSLLAYIVLILAVPLAAIFAALISLRRVKVSPLGVAQKIRPNQPRAWSMYSLVGSFIGFMLFLLLIQHSTANGVIMFGLIVCLLIFMTSLVIAGPWLTMIGARVLSAHAHRASSLLASRRLLEDPKSAFRTISGLMVITFSATILGCSLQFFNADANYGQASQQTMHALGNTAFLDFANTDPAQGQSSNEAHVSKRLSPVTSQLLLQEVHNETNATVVPLYNSSTTAGSTQADDIIVDCANLVHLPPPIQHCPPGTIAMHGELVGLNIFFVSGGDVPLQADWLTRSATTAETQSMATQGLGGAFILTDGSAHTLEQLRTIFADYTMTTPMTFAESQTNEHTTINTIEHIFYAGVGIMVFVAACNLVVALVGTLLERKMPFTLLRASGVGLRTLQQVMLLEAFLPLLGSIIFAGGCGLGMAYIFFTAIHKSYMPPFQVPTLSFWLILLAGLGTASLIICSVIPIIGRMTRPDTVRFE